MGKDEIVFLTQVLMTVRSPMETLCYPVFSNVKNVGSLKFSKIYPILK